MSDGTLVRRLRNELDAMLGTHVIHGTDPSVIMDKTMSVSLGDLQTLLALAEEAQRMTTLLKDPAAVHLNMLRGGIATPHVRSMLHLVGDKALARWERGKSPDDPTDW